MLQSEQWIVQKYGGTSVGKFLPAITSQIVPSYLSAAASATDGRRLRIALVCSARSGSTKAKGTTNLLLTAATQALEADNSTDADLSASALNLRMSAEWNNSRFSNSSNRSSSSSSSTSSLPTKLAFEETVEVLLEEHLKAVDIAVKKDQELRQRLEADVRADCERLRQFLQAAKVSKDEVPR
jgi:aspartate kinase